MSLHCVLWVTADTDLSGCESPVFHFTAVPVVPMDFPTVTISAPSSTSSQIYLSFCNFRYSMLICKHLMYSLGQRAGTVNAQVIAIRPHCTFVSSTGTKNKLGGG